MLRLADQTHVAVSADDATKLFASIASLPKGDNGSGDVAGANRWLRSCSRNRVQSRSTHTGFRAEPGGTDFARSAAIRSECFRELAPDFALVTLKRADR